MNIELITGTRGAWWWSQRSKYNRGLIISGFIAFLLYNFLGELIIAKYEEFEETIFEMAFQDGIYLFFMIMANLFYTLGWIIDSLFNKSNSSHFREKLFALGYWSSFALPILFILSIMLKFLIWGAQTF